MFNSKYDINYGITSIQKLLPKQNFVFVPKISLANLDQILSSEITKLNQEQLESIQDIRYPINKHGLTAYISQYSIGIYYHGMNQFQQFSVFKYYNTKHFFYQNATIELKHLLRGNEEQCFNHIMIPLNIFPSWLQDKIKNLKANQEQGPRLIKK